jgi:hypothetical protein
MAVSTDYSTPVTVNGFSCRNCTDVDYAKKHIDPAHPKSGPYGIDAKDDPTAQKTADPAAVTFGGALSGLNAKQIPAAVQANLPGGNPTPGLSAAGAQLDISA